MDLLPGVSEEYVLERLSQAGGNEVESGKFASPHSSAALAVNAFAWFHEKPALLPPVPGTEQAGWPAHRVEVEYCARFPWSGGRHPWLDAYVETGTHLLGIESKRHEPFRDRKKVEFSEAYDRHVWGSQMSPYLEMKNQLIAQPGQFQYLDAAQLVKHALGLVAESDRRSPRRPILVYLYAEPAGWAQNDLDGHRREIDEFAETIDAAAVRFTAARWSDWMAEWFCAADETVRSHGERLRKRFELGAPRR